MKKRDIKTMLYWEAGERGLVMEDKKGTQNNYDKNFSERRKLHATQSGVSKRKKEKAYKAPEDFPQWKSQEELFDLQQFMQEIM